MTDKDQMLEAIRVQGDLVRSLKAKKAPKEEVSSEGKVLKCVPTS